MLESYIRDVAVATYALAFLALSVRALVDWRQRHDRSSLWFAAAYGSLAVVVLTSAAFELLDATPSNAASRAMVVVLAAYSPCLLWFASSFGTITRVERIVVALASSALALWAAFALDLPAPGDPPDAATAAFSIAFVATWVGVSVRIVTSLWIASAGRSGIVRGRMKLLAIGIVLLDVALVIQALDTEQQLRLLVAMVSAAAAIILLLGAIPPRWLRVVLRERELRHLRSAVAGIASASTEEEVLEALMPGTKSMLGADRIALVPFGHGDVIAAGYDEEEVAAIRRSVQALDLPEDVPSAVVDGRHVTRSAASWIVVDREAPGTFLGREEFDVLSSMDAVVRMSLARIRDAARIREHEQQLRTAIDIAEIGKWYWDVGADSVWWSPRMYDIFGVDRNEPLTYDRYLGLIAPEERERMAQVVTTAVETGAAYEVQHRIVRPDGSEAWLESRARTVPNEDGSTRRITGVTIDVTERHRREQELRDAVEVEREAARRLRELDELKSNILASVSHELRTPLTAVHGLAIVLQDRIDELTAEQRGEVIMHLVTEAERLAALFSDLLDIDRLRRGTVQAQRAPVDIRRLVTDIVDQRERREQFVLDVPAMTFDLDAPKVERILENLVVNAEKYAGIDATIRITAALVEGGLELRVEDDGPGVPEHLRELVFEPFNRGDAALGHAPGTGIGLSLVRQFARLHDGRAWVEDSPVGGACFVVWLAAEAEVSGPQLRIAAV